MPGTYNYAIGPWPWDPTEFGGRGAYVPPSGSVCMLDFRNDEQQGNPGRTDGQGLFAFPGAVPDGFAPIGYGYAPEVQVTPTARQEMQTRLGLSGPPIGDTLAQAAVSCFMDYGDPNGVSFARPLDLNAAGNIELWLEAHSCVHREWYDHRELLASKPKGRANRLRDLVRLKHDIADAEGKLPEVLGSLLLRCGYSRDELRSGAKGRKSEWQQLVSDATRAKQGAKLAAKEPRTQLVETWPAVGAITSGQSLPWAANSGTPLGNGSFASLGGAVYCNGTWGYTNAARCTTPVSSADHWIVVPVTTTDNYACGTAVRMNGTNTFYVADGHHNNSRRLWKIVTGTVTSLASAAHTGGFSATSLRHEAAASTISAAFAGYPTLSVTDSAIIGALLAGIVITPGFAPTALTLGGLTIDDGLSGGGGTSKNLLLMGAG